MSPVPILRKVTSDPFSEGWELLRSYYLPYASRFLSEAFLPKTTMDPETFSRFLTSPISQGLLSQIPFRNIASFNWIRADCPKEFAKNSPEYMLAVKTGFFYVDDDGFARFTERFLEISPGIKGSLVSAVRLAMDNFERAEKAAQEKAAMAEKREPTAGPKPGATSEPEQILWRDVFRPLQDDSAEPSGFLGNFVGQAERYNPPRIGLRDLLVFLSRNMQKIVRAAKTKDEALREKVLTEKSSSGDNRFQQIWTICEELDRRKFYPASFQFTARKDEQNLPVHATIFYGMQMLARELMVGSLSSNAKRTNWDLFFTEVRRVCSSLTSAIAWGRNVSVAKRRANGKPNEALDTMAEKLMRDGFPGLPLVNTYNVGEILALRPNDELVWLFDCKEQPVGSFSVTVGEMTPEQPKPVFYLHITYRYPDMRRSFSATNYLKKFLLDGLEKLWREGALALDRAPWRSRCAPDFGGLEKLWREGEDRYFSFADFVKETRYFLLRPREGLCSFLKDKV